MKKPRFLIVALLLCQVAIAGQEMANSSPPELTAARLLELFEQQLLARPDADVSAIEEELDRMRSAGGPRLRLSQRANWDFDQLVDLDLGASLSWDITDPAAESRLALTAKRLELARHNRRSQRFAQLLEFRRTLLLLAHLNEAEALLSRHRQQLLALRPRWRELEVALSAPAVPRIVAGGGAGAAPDVDRHRRPSFAVGVQLDPERVGYLEVVQALERTRRERSLLLLMVANRTGVDPEELAAATIGPPPRPDVDATACLSGNRFENSETIRAALLMEESLLAQRLEAARSRPLVTLDLSGDAGYSSSGGRPLSANLRLALQVALPAAEGVSSDVSLSVTPTGLSQELSIGWPPEPVSGSDHTDQVRRDYRLALQRARLNSLRNLATVQGARGRLLLREAELAMARSDSAAGAGALERLNDTARAELALLNAQLELDLALMQLAVNCDAGRPSPDDGT